VNELYRQLLFLPEQGTSLARSIDHLHYFIITVTMVSATAIGIGALLLFVAFRRRSESQTTPIVKPRAIHEVLFVGTPLVFFLVFFFIGFPLYVDLQTPPRDAMDVYVEAKKWMWKFAYPGGPNSIDVLRVPAGRPVRLLMTSRDVIHSFFVPGFRQKQDVLPGRYTQTWFQADAPGRHQIFCAEYCGAGHSTMLGEVWVLKPEEFDAWLAEQRRGNLVKARDSSPVPQENVDPRSSLVQEGERLAGVHGCLKCHTIDGTPHIGPTWVGLYMKRQPLVDGRTVIVDEAYITRHMMDPRSGLAVGFQSVMPTFQGRIPPPDTAAIVEFIKSLRTYAVRPEPSRGPVYGPIPK
jgi:cytochrome c oxidase subunit 2